jgi:hypothetical protein
MNTGGITCHARSGEVGPAAWRLHEMPRDAMGKEE